MSASPDKKKEYVPNFFLSQTNMDSGLCQEEKKYIELNKPSGLQMVVSISSPNGSIYPGEHCVRSHVNISSFLLLWSSVDDKDPNQMLWVENQYFIIIRLPSQPAPK